MELLRDLRFGLRTLVKNPAASLVCVVTLALGIGANTAIFSVIDAVLLRPIPYPNPGRLVQLQMTYESSPGERYTYYSGPVFLALRERLKSFDSLAALYTYSPEGFNLNLDGRSLRISRLKVSSDYFDVLGIQPQLGRTFTRDEELLPGEPDEDRPASADPPNRLAILSHHLWQEFLGGNPEVLGEPVLFSGIGYTVIGVMPAGFEDPVAGRIDVWVPHNLSPGGYNNPGNSYLTVLGRLAPNTGIERAREELQAMKLPLMEENLLREQDGVEMERLQTLLIGNLDSTLYILLAAVAILLLIACVNVANLQLSQYAARSRELAVRAAIGGSPGRLTRQLLTENLLLVILGGAAGIVLAVLGVRILLGLAPQEIQDLAGVSINSRVLLFTTLVALGTGLLFGLAPAWRSSKLNIEQVLRQSIRGTASGGRWMGRGLVIGQITLSVVLLVAAALLLISFRGLLEREGDVRIDRIHTYRLDLSGPRYQDPEARVRFYGQLHAAVGSLPGVESTGAISKLPLSGPYHSWSFRIEGREPEQAWQPAQIRVVDGKYFETLEIPLLRGRLLQDSDRADTRQVVVVNRVLVDSYFPDEEVLGRSIRIARRDWSIVGIVDNVRHSHLQPAIPKVYLSHDQFAWNRTWALDQVVATSAERPDLPTLIRAEVARLDPELAIFNEASLAQVVSSGIAQQRFATTLMTVFGLLALILAVVGVHGILAQTLSTRAREFAIRKALGAGRPQMLAIVFREALLMAGLGALLGMAGGFLSTRWMQSLLHEVSPNEPRVFAAASLFLLIVVLLVATVPALRILRLRPVEVLRNE